jgi:DNA polymerase-3 subunit epsilon
MLEGLLQREGAVDDSRWVVLDVNASGRDANRDRLLGIAALALRVDGDSRASLVLADSIDVDAEPASLQAFEAYAANSPLVAFYTSFSRTLIDRAFDAAFGRRLANPWLDIEHLAEVLHPEVAARSLDEWIAHFGIVCAQRHEAAADTMACAELLLKLWPDVARSAPKASFAAVARLAAQRRWTRRFTR